MHVQVAWGVSKHWLSLDADGFTLPSDWYLRLASEIARGGDLLCLKGRGFRLRDPIPVTPVRHTLNDSFGAAPVGAQPSATLSFYERERATGYSQQINLSVQREVTGGSLTAVVACAERWCAPSAFADDVSILAVEICSPGG